MSITGAELSSRIRQLLPNNSYKLTPKLLNDTCENTSVQPFLRWFCEHVGQENVLLREEVQLRKRLQETGAFLSGEELERELIGAIGECPELLMLVQRTGDGDVGKEYEVEKDAYDADVRDIETLELSLKTLKDLENQLEEEIEAEEADLQKIRIQECKLYEDYAGLIDGFDSACRETYDNVQTLVGVYGNAAEKKGPPIVWTQVPLDLFIKHTDTYNNYLRFQVSRELKQMQNDVLSTSTHGQLGDEDSSEQMQNDRAYELITCQNILIASTLEEIEARQVLTATEAVATHALDIYNHGEVKSPESVAQMKVEMAELISRRDILEETNLLMETRLQEAANYYGKFVITKILLENGQARLERRKKRLSRMERLLHFARDMGHAHSDLLAILMQVQLRKLNEIVEFVNDIRYHIAAEYIHASKRCEFMEKEQEKYSSIITAPSYKQNIFNELFSSLLLGKEKPTDALDLSTKQYDELLIENRKMKGEILGVDLDRRIDMLGPLEKDVMTLYDHETSEGMTKSFKLMPYKIATQLEEVTSNVEAAQTAVNETRKKYKDIVTKTANGSLEREKSILWQRFLSDPETLKAKYDEAQRIVDRSHFVNSLDS
ncbi:uncharacterized protein [Fopius arisanus]|uniref:HAUS augmin-like complex subunit 3 N-terminal domain-containing protein n=2 Tax=Fopius arisanus TaxID=64838 RepID=A0A9R1TKY7_9HYME|nr:PREDICTED: uncharacterized protein LOC105271375 [Fopius arisanus]XP_011311198.1 PREDICTED: uncharacterized protein LOC105271375 [Fopius arisanus]